MLPTAATITNLYVFGQTTPPEQRMDGALLRPPHAHSTVDVDMAAFMAQGAGRFATPAQFALVQRFFADTTLPPGKYSKRALAAHYHMPHYGLNLQHYNLRDGTDDYAERVYVYNSQGFKLADSSVFMVAPDGSKTIAHCAVEPRTHDNFDFHSDDVVAQLGNGWLQRELDPASIGRRVDMHFTGHTPTTEYDAAHFAADTARVAGWRGHNPLLLARGMERLVKQLKQAGCHSHGCPQSEAEWLAYQHGHTDAQGRADVASFVRQYHADAMAGKQPQNER